MKSTWTILDMPIRGPERPYRIQKGHCGKAVHPCGVDFGSLPKLLLRDGSGKLKMDEGGSAGIGSSVEPCPYGFWLSS